MAELERALDTAKTHAIQPHEGKYGVMVPTERVPALVEALVNLEMSRQRKSRKGRKRK